MNKARLKRRICTITSSILFMLCVYLCMPKIEKPEVPTFKTIPVPEIQVTTLMSVTEQPEYFHNEAADLRAEITASKTAPDLYTLEEREIIARVVHAEARGECFEGQVAVARVVLNRLESGEFGKTLKHITRRSQFAKSKTYNEENMRAVNEAIWNRPYPDDMYFFCRGKQFYGEFYIKIGNHCFFVGR